MEIQAGLAAISTPIWTISTNIWGEYSQFLALENIQTFTGNTDDSVCVISHLKEINHSFDVLVFFLFFSKDLDNVNLDTDCTGLSK